MLSKLRLALVFALVTGLLVVASAASAAVPNCDGLVPTITGTSGPDIIDGTAGDDVIHGLGGNDQINGRGGNDVICGGLGDDLILGSEDNDRIFGQGGEDDLRGGLGDDYLHGGNANDALRGNAGNDELLGRGGDDELFGHAGDDTLKGGPGANILSGGDGNDLLIGGNDSETIAGGAGDDTAKGNRGDDEISGNAGNDNLRGGDGDDIILGGADTDDAFGGDGFDRCIDIETARTCEDDDFNDAPIGADDALATSEDLALVANVLADNGAGADSDPNGDTISISAVNGNPAQVGVPVALGSGVTVTVASDGALSYDPTGLLEELDDGDEVVDTFTYTVSDASESGTATVTITVAGVNDAPEAGDDTAEVDEDDSVIIDVLDNDSDVDGDELEVDSFTQGDNGTVTENEDGTLTYTPDEDYNGSDSFTYNASDGDEVDGATVIIGVVGVNDPPVAVDDTADVDEDDSVEIDVLDNDSDVDGDELEVVFVGTADNGSVVIDEESGLPVYTPNENFNGEDSFTYIVTDGEPFSGDVATVTVTVNPVNDDPTAEDDTAEVDEDSSVIIDVVDNDDDIDGDELTPVLGVVTNGGAVVNEDGTVTFTPDPDFFGEASFTYTADDDNGGTSEAATVTITVNGTPDDPVAEDDDIEAVEDGEAVEGNLLDNDDDVDGDDLTVIELGGDPVPFGGSHTETLSNGDIQVFWNGDFIFTPGESLDFIADGATLIDTFTYVIDDGTARTDAAIGTVTMLGENDDPVAVDDPDEDTYLTDEETAITLTDLLDNDSDVDSGDVLFISAVDEASAEGASLTITEGGDVLYDPSGALDNIPLGSSVVDTFTYTVADGNGGTDTAIVSITVDGVNDDPTAAADDVEITEDTFEIFIDVLDNDTDPDDGETATLDVTGIVVLDAVGQITPLGGPDDLIRYRPGGNFMDLHDGEEATDVFQYILEDVSGALVYGTVTITITGINEPWDAVDDPDVETDEDVAVAIDVLDNDGEDEEADDPTVTIVPLSGPTNGSVEIDENIITYTPDEHFNGVDSFDYQIDDGFGGTDIATVTITVNAVNDAPVAVTDTPDVGEDDGDTFIDVLDNDTDVEDDELSIDSYDDTGTTGIVTLFEGDLSYDPDGEFESLDDGESTTDSFTYIISDGTDDSAPGTVTVTINGANDAPVANDDSGELDEDSGSVTIDVLDNDTDVDIEDLSIDSFTEPANGDVALVDGELVYTPDEHFNGEDTFTYVASDGTAVSESATVTITVNSVNDTPVAVADEATVGEDDEEATIIDVLFNDEDADEDELAVVSIDFIDDFDDQPIDGIVTLVEGVVSYDPNGEFESLDDDETTSVEFDYVINDGTVDSEPGTVTVTINGANDAPVANDDTGELDEDSGSVTIDVVFNDTDVDVEDLSIFSFTQPENGEVSEVNGQLVYTPDEHFNGEDTFTYIASDGTDQSESATVTITVNPVNDPPVAVGDSDETDEDTPVEIDVLFNDSDIDEDDLTPIVVVEPRFGTAEVTEGGEIIIESSAYTITYTPNENYNGPDSFTYKVNDGTADSNTVTVEITVNAVNDAPVAVTDEPEVGEDDGDTVVDVLGNDTDVEDDELSVTSIDDEATTGIVSLIEGVVSYDPDGQFESLDDGETSTDTFTYIINDGTDDSEPGTVTVTINGVNDAPEADNDDGEGYVVPTGATVFTTPNVLANDTDVDDEPLSITEFDVDATLGLVTYNLDGTFTYEPPTAPALPEGATDSWTYTVSDGDLTDTATVTIVINSQPVANDDPSETTTEDSVLNGDSVLDNDTDAQGHTLTVSEVNGSASNVGVELTLASGALLTVYADGTYDYDPNDQFEDLVNPADTELDGFVYTATDGAFNGFSEIAIVTITVTGVNDSPSITTSATFDAAENQTAAGNVDSTDPEGDTEGSGLTYSITGGVDAGLLSIDANTGALTFDSAPNYEAPADNGANNTYAVQVTVTDSGASTDVQNVIVTVTDVNEAPEITSSDTFIVPEFVSLVGDVDSDDPDGETENGGGLTYSITGGDAGLFSIDPDTGELTIDPVPADIYFVQVTVTDSGALTGVQDVTVIVDPFIP